MPQPLPQKIYTATATATHGRNGSAKTTDGRLDVALSMPKQFGGDDGPGTNPEQLFAAGYAACFGSAANLVAKKLKVETTAPISITANVSIGPIGNGAFGLQVELVASVPGAAREQAEAVVRAAHEVCPYSNATRNNVVVDIRVE
jgi:Ohr subfamily peroxiredoxin